LKRKEKEGDGGEQDPGTPGSTSVTVGRERREDVGIALLIQRGGKIRRI